MALNPPVGESTPRRRHLRVRRALPSSQASAPSGPEQRLLLIHRDPVPIRIGHRERATERAVERLAEDVDARRLHLFVPRPNAVDRPTYAGRVDRASKLSPRPALRRLASAT